MSDLNDFYSKILNIRTKDVEKIVDQIVAEEKEILFSQVQDTEGFCIYLSQNIMQRLKNENINVVELDLNDFDLIDHHALLVQFRQSYETNNILIDPTYSQFVSSTSKSLINLKEWPSNLLEKELLDKLLIKGYSLITNEGFNNYLKSFGYNEKVDLDTYILDKRSELLR